MGCSAVPTVLLPVSKLSGVTKAVFHFPEGKKGSCRDHCQQLIQSKHSCVKPRESSHRKSWEAELGGSFSQDTAPRELVFRQRGPPSLTAVALFSLQDHGVSILLLQLPHFRSFAY